MKPLFTIRRTANRHDITDRTGYRLDLSRYFTIGRDVQGVRADRAGEFQNHVVNPVKGFLLG